MNKHSPLTIFLAFSGISIQGFGGVMPFAYRGLVERQRWLSAEEFAKYLAMAQILPGPTICNVAVMVGHRYAGWRGGLAAIAGMIAAPFFIVVGLAAIYQKYGNLPLFHQAVSGMSAVAAGLILATGLKMALALFKKSGLRNARSAVQLALLAAAFVGLGVLRWQLLLVFCVLVPLGVAAAYLMGEHHA